MKKLSNIRRRDLEEYVFPGTDAAVLCVGKKATQKDLEDAFCDISGDHRFYKTDEGWRVKFPYWYIEAVMAKGRAGFRMEDFTREPNGWDHEHCSFCHAHIDIGEQAFTYPHEKGGVYVICLKCSEQCKGQPNKTQHRIAHHG